ncbi:hypothetical protein CYY_005373 [Polysphondylium violaceum]|uniref:EF-hand domain-containing protein n=1 Tax=Polysphondylium violaceum TaxID=133409 RepID=A0A8J4UYP6_9MYCE|nr:hypothetical protein CYY_005373 [Polysphondylium violaceum]
MEGLNSSEIKLVEEQVQNFFNKIDKDLNGVVTYGECIDYWKTQGVKDPKYITNMIFLQNDKNNDARITTAEFRSEATKLRTAIVYNKVHELNLATFLSKFDINNDAKITLTELENEFKRVGCSDSRSAAGWLFSSMDRDKDGIISMDDLTKCFQKIYPKKIGTFNFQKP